MENFSDAAKSDCESLLHRFQRTDSVRYEEFSAIWRDMKFSTVFYGKMAANEKRFFSREILAIASHYFLPPYSFQIRVGSLYLLYGLYNTQLCSPKEKIRIALKDWDEVLRFQEDVTSAQHYDAAYIMRRLFLDKAFYFCAMPEMLCYRMGKRQHKHPICEEFRDRPARVKDLVNLETLEEVLNVHEHYHKMKCAISASASQPDSSLSLIQQDLVPQLKDVVLDFHNWQEKRTKRVKQSVKTNSEEDNDADAGQGSSQQDESSRRAQLLASIKSKSYGQLVEVSKSRRHRQTEMESSGSGSDQGSAQAGCGGRKRKTPPSLKARIAKEVCSKVTPDVEAVELKEEATPLSTPWRLSIITEKDEELEKDYLIFVEGVWSESSRGGKKNLKS
uniref:Small nuclear RNA activating complex, polypeptide 1a n=1 Tax=Lepisosteus oculatus TaxID=7918 RepID=W5MVN5_LEPOC